MEKIGILGSGVVGQTLAKGFKKHGYEVMIGSRSPDKLSDLKGEDGSGIQVGTFNDTASFGETLVLAAKGTNAADVLYLAGAENLNGKTILDATNPISDRLPPDDGVLHFTTSLDRSLMEQLQQEFVNAHFVKALNSVGNAFMVDPDFNGLKPTMFIAGDDAASKLKVSAILEKFGWEVEDMGSAKSARVIEPLCILWCIPGFLRNEWNHAFKLLKN